MKDIINVIDANRQLILDAERFIWAHPETGYKEFVTCEYLAKKFQELGYELTFAENITGFFTEIDTGKTGPKILILGELDSVVCPSHPEADPKTGAVHSCGHNAQCATLLGVASALKDKNILDKLCGKIMLCAVPAEEMIELEYRSSLMDKGIIKYFGGKCEFLHRGYFDGVDIAFMVHHSTSSCAIGGAVGILAKNITYKGVSAHAGGSPWDGHNALYAATCGLNAVNAIRETFKESDLIRFHPIITDGGSIVNAIPEKANIETYVRGKTYDAILSANKRINKALIGAALSIDTNIEITERPGYAPLKNDKNLLCIVKESFEALFPEEEYPVYPNKFSTGSTDMGDLSCVMPVIHPYIGGAVGKGHGNDYRIADPELACVSNAKFHLAILKTLLENNAEKAKMVISEAEPPFSSKEEYLAYIDSLNTSGERISYNGDGTATVKL